MDSLSLTTITTSNSTSKLRFSIPSFRSPKNCRNLRFPRRHHHKKFVVFAAQDEHKLDSWDQMELKFGKLMGEDPKLTLAKIMIRKKNPDLSNLEIEKLFKKKGGKALISDIEEVPFDVSDVRTKPANSADGLKLVRPVPKEGVKFEINDKPSIPVVQRPRQQVAKAPVYPRESVPDVILRKPTTLKDDGLGAEMTPRMSLKPNLSLKTGKEQNRERFSNMTLVRKPEPFMKAESETPGEAETEATVNIKQSTEPAYADVSLLQKPDLPMDQADKNQNRSTPCMDNTENCSRSTNLTAETGDVESIELDTDISGDVSELQDLEQVYEFLRGSQPPELRDLGSEKTSPSDIADSSNTRISADVAFLERPQRLDHPAKAVSNIGRGVTGLLNLIPNGDADESENLSSAPLLKEHEDTDWRRAEDLIKTSGRAEVELISSSTRGFVASFGSLIGYLPYRNLATKLKFYAFESWLREKGLDPLMYRRSLGIIGSYDATRETTADSRVDPEKVDAEMSPDMKFEDLLAVYDQEKLKYLSDFVGQKVKVNVILADRESRKLVFSMKPKEKAESVERKRRLMAKLSVGDVVKCCIKKIDYLGIFVEVEGVPALIHQSEVSWDDTFDPLLFPKVGQIVEAKVHQLDFSLERIFLSLKEITPDPLVEALEAVVGDHANLDCRLEAQPDNEWADVELLVKELQQYEGIESVEKGRFFLSPGLAPTFQVYMASMFENQYKLLARAGNKVQEVIVQTSLGKEEMRSAILTCTNRVQ